jgi:hypothetical protein
MKMRVFCDIFNLRKLFKKQEVMKGKIFKLFLTFLCISIYIPVFSQERTEKTGLSSTLIDSLKNSGIIFNDNRQKPEIILSTNQAVKFLQHRYQPQYWKDIHDPLRLALGQLIYQASHPPYDSAEYFLRRYPFDSINISWDKFYIWEPLRLKIPFLSPPEFTLPADSSIKADTNVVERITDSINLKSLDSTGLFSDLKTVTGLKDTTIMVIIDTLDEVTSAYSPFPFRYYNFPYQGDSINVAVKSLLEYVETRDSSIIYFTGITNVVTPVWLNSKSETMIRYWLKNELADSVTIWIGNAARNTVGMYLEQGVNFRRPVKQGNYADAKINVKSPDHSKLLNVQKIVVKPQYWKYRSEASFVLTQGKVTNWVKGGENSISMASDITGYADYNNKPLKLSSNNFARLKFGYIASGNNGVRKNLDLLETNSKLNHKAFGKFDFSAVLLFKTQIARGYNYPNDSVPVSKFMNPGILTIGIGLDYKPNKVTSINLSPLSYKGTFVPDTATIDQTKYGIPKDKRSINEPGASLVISNEYKPVRNLTVTNRVQLFTNYVNNPLNIDVDWEMIVVANLNWFTDVRFNTHVIFDDDTKTDVLDKNGIKKKTARIQFKEMLGFSFVFRF